MFFFIKLKMCICTKCKRDQRVHTCHLSAVFLINFYLSTDYFFFSRSNQKATTTTITCMYIYTEVLTTSFLLLLLTSSLLLYNSLDDVDASDRDG